MIASAKGYAQEAEQLIGYYERIPFADKHRAVLHLIPAYPCRVLDIGAGTGADAAWFADKGHRVVAVEPTKELRLPGMALHPSPSIEWLDDSARKTYIAVLEIMESPKVKVADGQIPADDPVVATYRRRLSSVILS